jgi:hypothetical protein
LRLGLRKGERLLDRLAILDRGYGSLVDLSPNGLRMHDDAKYRGKDDE